MGEETKMAGGKSTPKKDRGLKVGGGEMVKTGKILISGTSSYKAGDNVKGVTRMFALCDGKVVFTKKRTTAKSVKTFISVIPQ